MDILFAPFTTFKQVRNGHHYVDLILKYISLTERAVNAGIGLDTAEGITPGNYSDIIRSAIASQKVWWLFT